MKDIETLLHEISRSCNPDAGEIGRQIFTFSISDLNRLRVKMQETLGSSDIYQRAVLDLVTGAVAAKADIVQRQAMMSSYKNSEKLVLLKDIKRCGDFFSLMDYTKFNKEVLDMRLASLLEDKTISVEMKGTIPHPHIKLTDLGNVLVKELAGEE